MIEGEPSDLDFEKMLTNAGSPAETAKVTSMLTGNATDQQYRGSLGSAVDFYLRRAEEIHAAGGDASNLTLPDWNLDADRGYGFKCWEAHTRLDPQPAGGVIVQYQ
jgi:hypothetical protein